MSPAAIFWTVFVFAAVFIGVFVMLGWAWWWALLIAWLATGVAASIMGIQ